MAKKSKEKQPPPPTHPSASSSSSSSSSSDDEDSPPPAISPVKKPAVGSTAAVLQKQPEPSSKSIGGEEEEEGSESEEESTDEESSEDSGAAAAKANPPPQPSDPRPADGKQGLNTSPSDTYSEDGEEDGEEVDSSSESGQQPSPPPPKEAANAEEKKAATPISGSDSASEDESESSSDSDTTAPLPRSSSRNTADLSLKPLSSKPMDSPVQPTDKNLISRKRSTTSQAQITEKKRKTADIVGPEGGQEKKEITRRIWSKADELALLQCILDSNEHHHGTSTQVQVESLLKSVNGSLSSSVTLTQMNDKIRRLKQKYNTTIKKVNDANNPNISNAHDAAVFDLSRKIWGPSKEEPVFAGNNFKPNKVKESIKVENGKTNHLAVEYPFLRWHAKKDHANNALVVQNHIPTVEAKELEGSCKKLEITEIQLHMQKMKLLSSSLKLIEDAIAKL